MIESATDKCIHELFEEQARKIPDAIAAVYEEAFISYGELNCRANRLAHYLRKLGVKPDTRVAICVERSLEMITAILGIMKAGGAYVPLDVSFPRDRLQYMVEHSTPAVLLTQGHLQRQFAGISEKVTVIDLAMAAADCENELENNPRRATGLTPEQPVYVIYTSGSTGTPKGVMVEHRQLSNYAAAIGNELHLGQSWNFGFISTLAADLGNTMLFPSLLMGGVLHILSRKNATDGHSFHLYTQAHPLDCLKITPSHFSALLDGAREAACVPTQCLVLGGEVFPKELLTMVRSLRNECRIHNHYGPTECTVGALSCEVTGYVQQPSSVKVPLGRPLANMRIYILDENQEPVPEGATGELYIGGDGVARGYLNRPDLTAERFVLDPFSLESGTRMYKTGDLGRCLPDGTIEFLGRNDFQVKIHGFRIELGEIEARLKEQEGIKEAVVVVREDEAGEKRLVAYYTVVGEKEGEGGSERERRAGVGTGVGVGVEELRQHLLARLPEYMVPAAYVRLEALPLTANGKLDRKGLPGPGAEAYGVREYEAPEGETEEVMAGIWRELLHVERVGRGDNFFELGGHSLLAVRVIARVRKELGVGVKISEVFAHPTLAGLAGHIVDVQLEQFDAGEIGELLKQLQS